MPDLPGRVQPCRTPDCVLPLYHGEPHKAGRTHSRSDVTLGLPLGRVSESSKGAPDLGNPVRGQRSSGLAAQASPAPAPAADTRTLATGLTRPCCGAHADGFDRATGSVHLPHKVSERICAAWFARRRKP